MPQGKCSGCGKFISPGDAPKCTKCSLTYHRVCVGVPTKATISASWQCPECKKNARRDNKAETPVRGNPVESQSGESVSLPSPKSTAPLQLETPQAAASPTPATLSPPAVAPLSLPVVGTQSLVAEASAPQVSQEIPRDVASALKLVVEELRTLRLEVLELRKDVAELKGSSESCQYRMGTIEARLDALELQQNDQPTVSSAVENVVEELKRELNIRDQELMANDLMIANLPESNVENPAHIVKLVATKLGVTVEDRDIVSAERLGGRHIKATSPVQTTEKRPRAIMVRLARRDIRDALLDSARVRRGATTEDLGLPGPAQRFFVNERLTRTNQQLFRRVRAAAGVHGWRFVWTKRGRILARNKPGDSTHRFSSDEDILQFIGPYTEAV